MELLNREKGQLIYGFLDSSGFYNATAQADSRSLMNVTFRLPDEDLEKRFVQQALENDLGGLKGHRSVGGCKALENDLGGLKGHRSVGGCRASIYNATSIQAVQTLVDFMKNFESKNG